jgi:hypothetical protein
MGTTTTVVMSGHRVGGFAVRRYLTSSVAIATAGILAAGLVAGPSEVSVARNEVREMQLIAIALPATTPRPAMPMSFVRNQGRSVLSAMPAIISGTDATSAVAFVSAVQARSPLKEVIEPTTKPKIEPAKARQQVTDAAAANPDVINNPILRSIIAGAAFFVVIPVFWVVIVVTSAINVVLDALNLPLLPNVPDPPFGPPTPVTTATTTSNPETSSALDNLVVARTHKMAPSTGSVETNPAPSDAVEHHPDIKSATKPSSDAVKPGLRFARMPRGRDRSSLGPDSVSIQVESEADTTTTEKKHPLGDAAEGPGSRSPMRPARRRRQERTHRRSEGRRDDCRGCTD